ncbi:hypothetical protein ACFVZR_28250 [Streptomyces sp. NPDC058316]|uniref:hypothetical protein n=1 Tax=unclassified Streptomyces TaxID=2593676 RepID=UPI0036E02BFA
MLAEEFGYQVTSRLAVDLTATLRPEMEKQCEAAELRSRNSPSTENVVGFTIAASFIVCFIAQSWEPFFFGMFITLLAGSLNGIIVGSKRNAAADLNQTVSGVLASPWQAWPCRVEAIAGGEAKRLLLLDPQGGAARQLLAPAMPDEVWIGLTDGRGLIWFAGDLRFGGIASLPGGSPIFWVKLIPTAAPLPAPSDTRQRLIEEELARQAIAYVFDEWL